MKELSIEQKAKRYDNIIEKANKMHCENCEACQICIEELIPELKESEDERIIERIKKAVESYWSDEPLDEILAWLEKQGEQKLADKIVPKFKVGDWVVYDHRAYQVVELPKEGYINLGLRRNGKIEFAPSTYCRHWTIQDAKAGDVLCDCCEEYDNPLIFILKKFERVDFGLVKPSDYSSYCFLTAGDRQIFKEGKYHHKHNIKPATKEQRDLLFKKMHEVGYEWDAEKKELKKISQRMVSAEVKEAMYNKPTWSEEDEKFLDGIIANLEYLMDRANTDTLKQSLQKRIDWLKHLKERYTWKPSDEQIDALEDAIADAVSSIQKNMLNSLYQDIKKLKGE